jgi:hypothetical protein
MFDGIFTAFLWVAGIFAAATFGIGILIGWWLA